MSVPLMSFTSMPSGAGAFEDCMNPIGGGTKKNVLHKKTFCLISESDAQGSPSPHTFDTVALFGIYPSVSPLHSFGHKKKKKGFPAPFSAYLKTGNLLGTQVPRGEFRNWRTRHSSFKRRTGGLFTKPGMTCILKANK